ncbi:hypothetical protein Scep_017988 [Stephania cephalantha]|uniref:mRNA export factor GLE1 n=1 Tax=Stephania cephalantha TaxID=152367 RepID=A0AAP0IRH9_9MAGN
MKLELRCPNKIHGITVDPSPNWTVESLFLELNSLELNINVSSTGRVFTKTQNRGISKRKGFGGNDKAFVMRVTDEGVESDESDNEDVRRRSPVAENRFSFNDLDVSDSESLEDEREFKEAPLMVQAGIFGGLLIEQEHELQQVLKEEVRNKISALEMKMVSENTRSTAALSQVEKQRQARRDLDKKLDAQFRRKVAEALDNHLTAVQRDHEHRSQIEERKIQNDASIEEAKRKERALAEERARQLKAKAEAEAAKQKAEEARKEALEAERRAKEIAENQATETSQRIEKEKRVDVNIQAPKEVNERGLQFDKDESNEKQLGGSLIKASERALKLEAERLQKYQELEEKYQSLESSVNKNLHKHELQIGKRIKQITGTKDSVRVKAAELVEIMKDPLCPQSISIAMFAKKVVAHFQNTSTNFGGTVFACGQVIVHVASQVPLVMDILLAELHRACIYTVPKHVVFNKSTLSSEAYRKVVGFREEDGKLESIDQYLERVECCMKLYGAIVQTEVVGIPNPHGLKEGWAWLARLLNALPVNRCTAVALDAFLKMAGYALFRKYKWQFEKILDVISQDFVGALESRNDPKINPVILSIKNYLERKQFLKQPEGWNLLGGLSSQQLMPEAETGLGGGQNYHRSNRWGY